MKVRIVCVLMLAALAGCGGSDGGEPAATSPSHPIGGQVDIGYAADGRYAFTVPGYVFGSTSVGRVAITNDGSVYIAGSTIRKLDSGGNLDPGYVVPLESYSPLLDDAGNLYVLTGTGIAKLDRDGHPVTSFGTNGVALAPSGGGYNATFVQDRSSNFVLLAGVNVTKFDRDGRRVASFGNGGTATVGFPASEISYTDALAVDSEGNVFVGGIAPSGSGPRGAFVTKLDSDGRLASAFASGGSWFAPAICSMLPVQAIAFDATDRVYVACEGAIFKLDTAGSPDPSWSLLGVSTPFVGEVTSLLVEPNGEVFAAGRREGLSSCTDFTVVRLDPSGNPVSGFGVEGRVAFDVAPSDGLTNIAMDAARRLYVSGRSIVPCTILRPVPETTISVTRLR